MGGNYRKPYEEQEAKAEEGEWPWPYAFSKTIRASRNSSGA